MRISVDKSDPGYRTWIAAGRPRRVLLDGIELGHVITADEERREIVRFRTDAQGRLIPNAERTACERETLRGTVCILRSDDSGAGTGGRRAGGEPT